MIAPTLIDDQRALAVLATNRLNPQSQGEEQVSIPQ